MAGAEGAAAAMADFELSMDDLPPCPAEKELPVRGALPRAKHPRASSFSKTAAIQSNDSIPMMTHRPPSTHFLLPPDTTLPPPVASTALNPSCLESNDMPCYDVASVGYSTLHVIHHVVDPRLWCS